MLSLIGLSLTFLGGAVVLIPDMSRLYDLLHHVPPFSTVNEAEKRLYDMGDELTVGDVGFERLVSAIMESSQPYDSTSEYGSFREYGAEFPSPNGEVHVDFEECRVVKIEKKGDGFLSDSDFSVWMVPEERTEAFESILDPGNGKVSVITTEIPNGRFPEMVREYKQSIVHTWGMVLLVSGFVIGILGHLV
jgi:hypothetical protein